MQHGPCCFKNVYVLFYNKRHAIAPIWMFVYIFIHYGYGL